MALIKCPECEKQVSNKAQSCPNCGYPFKTSATFAEDLGKVKKVGVWLAVLLSAGSLTISALLAKIISPGSFGPAETQTLWTTVVLTAPLTLALGVYSALIFNKSFRDMADHYLVHLFIFLAIFVVTIGVSNLLDPQSPIKLGDLKNHLNLWSMPVYILKTYFQAYGAWNFGSAVVLGIFLGWTWEKLFAHARKRIFGQSTS